MMFNLIITQKYQSTAGANSTYVRVISEYNSFTMKSRSAAAQIIFDVIDGGKPLEFSLVVDSKDKAFIQELCFGVCRWFFQLDFIARQLLSKPFKDKDSDVFVLLLIGLYQLLYMRVPDHAAISETVAACVELKKPWAKGVLNAVLRNFLRQKDELLKLVEKNDEAKTSHPTWFLKKIQNYYPDDWPKICEANNGYPPLTLRVNQQKISRDKYFEKISGKKTQFSNCGVTLEKASDVKVLPGFKEGEVSVQDEAAQLAASLLDLKPELNVLDACAAPGGKTAHILETEPSIELTAVDRDVKRSERIFENLERLDLNANVICADAADIETWWDKKSFDRILVDAPCSAVGVMRRHPDIKLIREEKDVNEITKIQAELLRALWKTLKPGGLMLYATCSILAEENQNQIEKFLSETTDAIEEIIKANWGRAVKHGRQILPGNNNMDGFYYCLLTRNYSG